VRILSLFPSLDPAGGGIQSGGMSMVLASRRAGVEHVVSCTESEAMGPRSRLLTAQLEQAGIPVISFPQLRRPAQLAERWSASPGQVPWIWRRVGEFDAVHVHGIWNTGALSGLAFATLRKIPVVATAHESLTEVDIDTSRSPARRLQKLVLKSLYLRWTTLFILTSALETATSLPAGTPQETIPYALVDPAIAVPVLAPRGQRPELRIGYLGRIARKKNLALLIAALAQLPEHVRLTVAGDAHGELAQAGRRLAQERGVAGRIEWLGFVNPAGREEFLRSIDLLAMPSSFESFGMAAAEAMLSGVPVLVSERTGIAELIGRHGGGVVVKPDPDDIATAIRRLDHDRAGLSELGARAQRGVCDELSYDRVGTALRAAYERAVRAS
jgi:glycosyltransferase involved in cell wall biosynthesis